MGVKWIGLGVAVALAATSAAEAAGYDVRIRRDEWGVPHVKGPSDADVAYGLGFAQSEDDFATVQEAVFTARGRLSELKGRDGLETDYLVALQDVWGTVRRRY